jgi:hypothetical protein
MKPEPPVTNTVEAPIFRSFPVVGIPITSIGIRYNPAHIQALDCSSIEVGIPVIER